MLNTKNIDAVITYVDDTDQEWRSIFTKNNKKNIDIEKSSRYRSYNSLQIQINLIRRYMPFIDTIYIVVSSLSQIPKNLNNITNVKFILHTDIIPTEYLPTFNVNIIEMFLHNINNLKEYYLYFNDDIFPIKYVNSNQFFENNKLVMKICEKNISDIKNIFHNICFNSYNIAANNTNFKKDNIHYYVPLHSIAPMLKSDCIECFNKNKNIILKSLSQSKREKNNLNQYMFILYSCFKRGYNSKLKDYTYINLSDIEQFDITNCNTNIICVNDTNKIKSRQIFNDYTKILISKLNSVLI